MTTPPWRLSDVLDDAALLSLEHQLHLADVLGDLDAWQVDLAAGWLDLTGPTPRRCRVHLLGSAAPGPSSWLWSWANPSGYPEAVTGLAARVRDFGSAHGIGELATPEVPFGALPSGRRDVGGAVAVMTDAAKVVSGLWTSYTGEVGGGTRAAFLVEHPDFALPAVDAPRVQRVITQGIAQLPLTDHRRAIASYARFRPLDAAWSSGGDAVTLRGPRFEADVRFDERGRFANLSARLG